MHSCQNGSDGASMNQLGYGRGQEFLPSKMELWLNSSKLDVDIFAIKLSGFLQNLAAES